MTMIVINTSTTQDVLEGEPTIHASHSLHEPIAETISTDVFLDDAATIQHGTSDSAIPSFASIVGDWSDERIQSFNPWSRFGRLCRNAGPLLAVDALVAAAGLLVSIWLTSRFLGTTFTADLLAWLMVPMLGSLLFAGLYPGIGMHPVVELRRLAVGTTMFATAMLVVLHAAGVPTMAAWVATSIALGLLLVGLPLARVAARRWLGGCAWWGERVLILGGGSHGQRIYHRLQRQPERGLRPVAIVTSRPISVEDGVNSIRLRSSDQVSELARKRHIAWAIISDDGYALGSASLGSESLGWQSLAKNIPHLILVNARSVPGAWTQAHDFGSAAGLHVRQELAMQLPNTIKRVFDMTLAAALLVLAAPLFVLLGLAIKCVSPGPVFYGHLRFGRHGGTFRAWKFRTMRADADQILHSHLEADPQARAEWERDHKLRFDPRVIPWVGETLRKWSLDELPQLWNVLLGDMSLVGPRPIVSDEISKYGEDYLYYMRVRPGITGLWQVSGRNDTGYVERVRLDCDYVRNWSPWLDLYILARTVPTVLWRQGAY